MKDIIIFFKKNWLYFTPILLLGIFIISIWDKNYYIGGDLMFPLKAQDSILKSIYLWVEENGGGSFFSYTLLLWQGFFYVLSLVGIPSFLSIKIFIVLLYSLGFIFAYLTFKNLFKETRYREDKFAFLSAFLFFLNPAAILVLVGAIPLYAFPVGFYFIIKFLDNPKPILVFLFAFFVNISFFTEGPQLKLAVTFVMGVIFLLFIYKALRQMGIGRIIWRMLCLVFLTICLNLFILLPFVNEAFGSKGFYQRYSQTVSVYNGNGDIPWAALPYTMRFFNSALIDKVSSLGQFLVNPVFVLWTFFLWVVLLTGILLINDKKEKRIIFWLFLPLLFFIFLAKGANPPFGEVYKFLLFNVPVFKLFRTTSTVIIGGVSFFAFLLTIAIFNLSKKWKYLLPLILLINIIVFHPIYLGFKLNNYSGEDFVQKGISIPIEYFKMGKTLDDLKDDNKILSLPQTDNYTSKTWYFGQSLINWITKKPLLFNLVNFRGKLENFSSQESCFFSSMYNIGYVLQEKDGIQSDMTKTSPFLGEKIIDNQYFNLIKVNPTCSFSHFYFPRDLIYFDGDANRFLNIAEFPDFNLNSSIFLANRGENLSSGQTAENKKMLELSNRILIERNPDGVDLSVENKKYVRLDLNPKEAVGVYYPHVRIRPDSLLYPLVKLKEKYDERKNRITSRTFMDYSLFLAEKRISEIFRWGINNSWSDSVRDQYREQILRAIQLAKQLKDQREGFQIIIGHLNTHRQKINDISREKNWSRKKIMVWNKMFDNLRATFTQAGLYEAPLFNKFVYTINVPLEGRYRFNLTNDKSFSTVSGFQLILNGQNLASPSANAVSSRKTIDIGEYSLKASKNYQILASIDSQNLIDPFSWKDYKKTREKKEEEQTLTFNAPVQDDNQFPADRPILYQNINEWKPGDKYLIKMKYRSSNKSNLRLLISIRRKIYDQQFGDWHDKVDTIEENIGEGNEFVSTLTADNDSVGATIYLYETGNTSIVENITVNKLIIPKLSLWLEKSKDKEKISPSNNISFIKINPSRYILHIDESTVPNLLTFSESFDRGWKAYITETQKTKEQKNIFFDGNTFVTWGKTPIPENRHFLVNGYANGWFILPEDLAKKTSYDIIIDYYPQRLFYVGIIFTLLTLVSLIIYQIKRFHSKR